MMPILSCVTQGNHRDGFWLQVLGLVMVRYFSRLMPLLLTWLHSPDPATQLESLRAVQCIICNTWPRIPPHARLVRQHLAVLRSGWALPPPAGETRSEQSKLGPAVGIKEEDALSPRMHIVLAVEELLSRCSPEILAY